MSPAGLEGPSASPYNRSRSDVAGIIFAADDGSVSNSTVKDQMARHQV